MIATVLFSILGPLGFTLVGLCVERSLLRRGKQYRGVWVSTLAISVAFSVAMLGDMGGVCTFLASQVVKRIPFDIRYMPVISELSKSLVVLSTVAFAALSTVEVIVALLKTQSWKHGWLDGVPVMISENLGPAVFGLPGRIVVPRWFLNADTEARAAAIAHEQEHLAARDRIMSTCTALLLLVVPWNPLVHLQMQRLRFATEADCDARVVHKRCALSVDAYVAALRRLRRGGRSEETAVPDPDANSWVERRIRCLLARQH